MALLSLDATVELETPTSVKIATPLEKLKAIEFVVNNKKVSTTWPLVELKDEAARDLLDKISDETVEVLSPSVLFYAPLGGLLSSKIRTLLRRGVARILVRLLIKRVIATGSVDGSDAVRTIAPFVSIEERGCRSLVRVHWSTALLNVLLTEANDADLCFSTVIPRESTLIPVIEKMKAADTLDFDVRRATSNVGCDVVFSIRVTLTRLEIVSQGLHDKRTADRLAYHLHQNYLKPAEQMREGGNDSLQLKRYYDAFDCYSRALELAQKGLLVPYRRALRPPPSLEDRAEGAAAEGDVFDEIAAHPPNASENLTTPRGHNNINFAPANKYFNTLLQLRDSKDTRAGGEQLDVMRTDPLLVNGRVIFPLAHPLLHVWYALHRQAIVAAANNAQALLQMQSTAVISSNSTEAATGWRSRELSANELRRRQMQAQRRCERALRMLRRISGWAILPLTQAVEVESSDVLKEWMWFQSIRFKLLIRRVRLLRIVGTFDACNRALEETCEQLRLLRSQDEMLCRSVEVQRLMDDVFNQITREKLLLRDEGAQKGGLVLRV